MVAQTISIRPAARWHALAMLGGLLGACLLLALCTAEATFARAADAPGAYDEMPVDPPTIRGWAKVKSMGGDVRLMLRGEAPFDQPTFDSFFQHIIFPQFTLYKDPGGNVLAMDEDPKNKSVTWRASKLPTCRKDFLSVYVKQANGNSDRGPFDHLNDITVQAMRTIALGNYHPLSRFNAAVLLASLREYQSEKPLRTALPALMACLDAKSDLVEVAALGGILAYAKQKTEGGVRPQMIVAMLKIAGEKAPPNGRTAAGHEWIRRRAIDVLAALGDAGPNLEVVAALDTILNDNQSPPELSCSAAKALGSISFRAPDTMNASATASSIGQVAVDIYKMELDRAAERHDTALLTLAAAANNPASGGAFGAVAGGVANPQPAAAADHDLYIPVQLLRSELYSLDQGMKGLITATAGTKHLQFAENVEKNLALLMTACDPTASDYETLKAQITKAGTDLETALASGAGGQGRAPAADKTIGGSKADAFDTAPAKPSAARVPSQGLAAPAVAPAAK